MTDLSKFDPNSAGNPNNNIFGLPFSEEEARLVILPVPWEVTVSFGSGTARSAEQIMKASLQVDLFDPNYPTGWQEGFFMKDVDRKVLLKSDYLRKEAELYIDYISNGDAVENNQFMSKALKEVNEGGYFLNTWVYQQTKSLLEKNKLVALLGGDHSTPLGFMKAIGEKYGEFGILQIDAHCDLREGYEGFVYSHASIMYNALREVETLQKLVQVGIRTFTADQREQVRKFGVESIEMCNLTANLQLEFDSPVYISFDVDALDPAFAPGVSHREPGGLSTRQAIDLIQRLKGKVVGADIVEFNPRMDPLHITGTVCAKIFKEIAAKMLA